jgi:NADP-dependent 3-hydroxy acid dehydrogenase YdfG
MAQQPGRRLEGRVAVITGASSGIGEATARLLAARGASVALLARRKDRLDRIAADIAKEGGKAAAWVADVSDDAGVKKVAAEVLARFGRVDAVVNNAGIMLPNPIDQLRTDQWHLQVDLNVNGLMNVIGAFIPALIDAAKDGKPADLVNISSIASKNIFPNFAVYGGTKAFVTQLSLNLRTELGSKGVRVSAIEPGIVGTELQSHVDFKGANEWLDGTRAAGMEWLEPDDIAEAIAFTVSMPRRMNMQQMTIMPTAQAT